MQEKRGKKGGNRREAERLEDDRKKNRGRGKKRGKRASLSFGSNSCTATTGARATTIWGAHPPNPANLKKEEKIK